MEKKPLSHIAAGAIIGAVMVIYSMVLQFMELTATQSLSWISYLIIIGLLVYFIILHGKVNENDRTFGQLFTYGFKASAVVAILLTVFNFLFFTAFPEYKDKVFDVTRTEMLKNPKITEAQVDQFMEGFRKWFWLGVVGGGIFGTMLIGAIGSLIGAGVAKKNPQSPFQRS